MTATASEKGLSMGLVGETAAVRDRFAGCRFASPRHAMRGPTKNRTNRVICICEIAALAAVEP